MNTKKYFEQGILTLLEKKNIDDITIGEIIEEVSSCKGTFYKHFIDKYDLCCNSFRDYIYSEIKVADGDWESLILQCLSVFEKQPQVIVHAFESNDCNSARKYHEDFMLFQLKREFVKNGGNANFAPNVLSMQLCVSYTTDIMLKWLKEGRKESKEKIISFARAVMPQSVYTQLYTIA